MKFPKRGTLSWTTQMAHCNHESNHEREVGGSESEKVMRQEKQVGCREPRNGGTSRNWKRQGNGVPSFLPKGRENCQPALELLPPDWATKFVITCYTPNRKLTHCLKSSIAPYGITLLTSRWSPTLNFVLQWHWTKSKCVGKLLHTFLPQTCLYKEHQVFLETSPDVFP
jgi:hypothetical protein